MIKSQVASEFIEKMEQLLIEYHQALQAEPDSPTPDGLVAGVDFLISFDVRGISQEGVSGSTYYAVSGNQGLTTSLGLADRGTMYVNELIMDVEEDDSAF